LILLLPAYSQLEAAPPFAILFFKMMPLFGTAEAVPFPIKVKVEIKSKGKGERAGGARSTFAAGLAVSVDERTPCGSSAGDRGCRGPLRLRSGQAFGRAKNALLQDDKGKAVPRVAGSLGG
jgi:hypothetical protein